jgi:hypothetical protein
MSKRKKACREMTPDELAAATAEFEQDGISTTFLPMSKAEEAAWRRMMKQRRGARDPQSNSVRVISVRVASVLPKRADAFAKRRGISRAKLIAKGIDALLAQGEP